MADYPALPLWTDAYLADTRHLNTLEHGAYLLLLIEAWRRPRCSLPNDDALLAKLAGLTADDWARVRPAVIAFWQLDRRNNELTQKRLSRERDYCRSKSRKQSHRALKRWRRTKTDDAAAMPDGMPDRCRSDAPTPTPTDSVSEDTDADRVPASPVPPDDHQNTTQPAAPKPTAAKDSSHAARLFDRNQGALGLLIANGASEASARSLIGRWRKTHPDDAIVAAVDDARRHGVADPRAWITAALKSRRNEAAGDPAGALFGNVSRFDPADPATW